MASEQTMVEVPFVLRPDWATVDLAHSSLGLQACVGTPQAGQTFCLLWIRVASDKD
jgi:hypothetical protein